MSGILQTVFQNLRSFVETYWLATILPSVNSNVSSYGITTDITGNVYVCAQNNDFTVVKYNNLGSVVWGQKLGASSGAIPSTSYNVIVDTSSNVYVIGTQADSTPNTGFEIVKYNSSGTIQWQNGLFFVAGSDSVGQGIGLDSSSNVYVTGHATDPTNFVVPLVKYNSSGTLQWQRKLTVSTSTNLKANGIAVDSSGNSHIVYTGSTATTSYVSKIDSTGATTWNKSFVVTGLTALYGVALDSSGNVYVAGGNTDAFIGKFDSSGALQWSRKLSSAANDRLLAIAVDSSGNAYVSGYNATGGNNNFLIAKYDTSGTIQWQRTISCSAGDSDISYGITVNNAGYICVSGIFTYSAPFTYGLILKLPTDGSKTGTYTVGSYSFTYAASSLTDAAAGATSASVTLTNATGAFTLAATGYASSSSTLLTSTVTTIP